MQKTTFLLLLFVPFLALGQITNGTIHIKTKDKLQKLQLFNTIGRKVFETTNLTNNQVNFSHINAGAYILRLIDWNNNTKTQKLIIN